MKTITLILTSLTLALTSQSACTIGNTVPKPETSIKAISLAGSEWGPLGENALAPDVFIGFKSNGKVSGHAGCNSFFASYSQDGEKLSIGAIGSTKKMCQPELMETERALLKALSDTQSISASHLSLILRGANGTSLLTLRRRDWD